ncbi:hypothetical protein B0H13DRAFT_1855029 [Mycena leptocephala]|nr:hypothetical protein B0H13DRAFT_1855029 [Mycena leptocephala]
MKTSGKNFWYSVHIQGAFPVLSTGITLVDLPGHGDVDNSRASITSIARAIDDRNWGEVNCVDSHRHRCTRNGFRWGREVDLAMDIAELTAQIDVLKKRIARGRPETLQEWKTKITAKRQAREQRIFQRHKLLAQRRSGSVASALQEKCRHIYSTLWQLPEGQSAPHIPIFCVGSCDYLCLSRLLPATPLVFSSEKDTSIPALHEYIQLMGEFHNLTDGVDILSMMYQLLNWAVHVPSGDIDVRPGIRQDILDLEKCSSMQILNFQSTLAPKLSPIGQIPQIPETLDGTEELNIPT